jgi:hypothetical protein
MSLHGGQLGQELPSQFILVAPQVGARRSNFGHQVKTPKSDGADEIAAVE